MAPSTKIAFKICKRCGIKKRTTEFARYALESAYYGIYAYCRNCQRIMHVEEQRIIRVRNKAAKMRKAGH